MQDGVGGAKTRGMRRPRPARGALRGAPSTSSLSSFFAYSYMLLYLHTQRLRRYIERISEIIQANETTIQSFNNSQLYRNVILRWSNDNKLEKYLISI